MMLSPEEIRSVQSVLLVANAPRYVVRRVRALPFIQRLAESRDPLELLNAFREAVRTMHDDPDAEALGVAVLVALAISEHPDAVGHLRAIDPREIPWGPEIRDFGLGNRLSTSSMTISVQPQPILTSESD